MKIKYIDTYVNIRWVDGYGYDTYANITPHQQMRLFILYQEKGGSMLNDLRKVIEPLVIILSYSGKNWWGKKRALNKMVPMVLLNVVKWTHSHLHIF